MATLVHFDISADNINRARTFYEQIFGWKFIDTDGPVPYQLIQTTDSQGNPGIGGGIAKRIKDDEGGITNFIGVENIDDYLKKVEEAGGTIIDAKMPVPGYGFLAVCRDTEGNRFGLWENETDIKDR